MNVRPGRLATAAMMLALGLGGLTACGSDSPASDLGNYTCAQERTVMLSGQEPAGATLTWERVVWMTLPSEMMVRDSFESDPTDANQVAWDRKMREVNAYAGDSQTAWSNEAMVKVPALCGPNAQPTTTTPA